VVTILIFAVVLLLAALLSRKASQSILSTAVIFLVAGILSGEGVAGLISFGPDNPVVAKFAELALFSVLFTDGMRVNARNFSWSSCLRLPGRALVVGLPLTIVGNALLAHLLVGLPWLEAFLLGAVLGPTDPVFASAIVGRKEVPQRLRHLLNLESGLNDGLALPVIIPLLALIQADQPDLLRVLGEVVWGIGLGIIVPALAIWLMKLPFFEAVSVYRPLQVFAIGLLVLSLSSLLSANEFLAAFAAGITIATLNDDLREQFAEFGETITELLKLSALLVFGALLNPAMLTEISLGGYLFALLALLLVRPIALAIAFIKSKISWQEWLVGGWFGPKGFSSVFYALLVWEAGLANRPELFNLAALVIACSMIAHSSTDLVVVRWFQKQNEQQHNQDNFRKKRDRGEMA
jgi:NhaP-type Na+/H+ or K+/H+ antiporter